MKADFSHTSGKTNCFRRSMCCPEVSMNDYYVEKTKHTPTIRFDGETNLLEIRGMSYPTDISEFYNPFFTWLKNHLSQASNRRFTVNIQLIYLNSGSTKAVWRLLVMLEKAVNNGRNIIVNWEYEVDDDDKLELGEEFQEDLSTLPFLLVAKKT